MKETVNRVKKYRRNRPKLTEQERKMQSDLIRTEK
jgi:hypothetical protein